MVVSLVLQFVVRWQVFVVAVQSGTFSFLVILTTLRLVCCRSWLSGVAMWLF